MSKVKRVSKALQEKLRKQRNEMRGSSDVMSNKFSKKRLRLLPTEDEVPGTKYTSFFSKSLNKGTTAPSTFGLPDPLMDAVQRIRKSRDKEASAHVKAVANPSVEFWMKVIDREDEGTPQAPKVQIFRCKQTLYDDPIIETMADEDDPEDVTDVEAGQDLRVRRNPDAKRPMDVWKGKFLDASPLHEDETYVANVLKIAEKIDPTDRFFKVNLELYCDMYDALTGEALDEDVLEVLKASDKCYDPRDGDDEDAQKGKKKSKKPADDDDDDDDDADDEDTKKKSKKPADDDEDEDDTLGVGTRVSFEADGETVEGVISEVTDAGYVVRDTDDEQWDVNPDETDLTVLDADDSDDEDGDEAEEEEEPEEDEEEEEEPEEDEEEDEEEEEEEEPPKKPTKKSSKSGPSKKTAPASKGKKAAPVTTKGKKSPKKAPGKKASSSIRSRLRKRR